MLTEEPLEERGRVRCSPEALRERAAPRESKLWAAGGTETQGHSRQRTESHQSQREAALGEGQESVAEGACCQSDQAHQEGCPSMLGPTQSCYKQQLGWLWEFC